MVSWLTATRIVVTGTLSVLAITVLRRTWKFRVARTKRSHRITRNIQLFWTGSCVLAMAMIWIPPPMNNVIPETTEGAADDVPRDTDDRDELINTMSNRISRYEGILKKSSDRIAMASRRVSYTYQYDGTRIDTRAYRARETKIYERMESLYRERRYSELKYQCEQQIRLTPDWLTPYLYLGGAYLHLGDLQNASTNVAYYEKNAYHDIQYAEGSPFQERLRSGIQASRTTSSEEP